MKNQKGQGLVEYALVLVLVAIVVIASATLIADGLSDNSDSSGEVTITEIQESDFEYIVVDGMACIVYHHGFVDASQYGVSCDFSTWDGEVVNGEIVIRE